jgi:hypothetical protein
VNQQRIVVSYPEAQSALASGSFSVGPWAIERKLQEYHHARENAVKMRTALTS